MKDYLYIRAWGIFLGSKDYYINWTVSKARKENAPERAIFFSEDDDKWETVDGIQDKDTFDQIESLVAGLKLGLEEFEEV